MKKTLFGTTALIAASLAMGGAANAQDNEGIQLGVGGYMNNFFAIGDVESDNAGPGTDSSGDFNETGFFSDGEIHFSGEYTLDNGITVGAQVELEAFSSGDQIDENYAYLDGSFGRVRLGSENTAGYMMHYAAPNVGVPVNSGWVTSFVAPNQNYSSDVFRHPGGSTYVDFGNDENNLTYFTPRLAGFQVGVSYVPTYDGGGDGANFPTNAIQNTAADGDGNHGVAAGLNYVNSFNGFDVALSGGYHIVTDENPAVFGDEPEQYLGGINLGYAGFTVGGSVAYQDSENVTGGDGRNDGISFDYGASYSTGPWTVGAMGFYSETEGSPAAGDDEMQTYQASVAYTLGAGVTTSLSGVYTEWEADVGTETDGFNVIGGLALSF